MRIVFLLVVFLVVVGCSRKATPSATATTVKDSIRIEIRERLVPVPVPGETVVVHDTIRCDEKTNQPVAAKIKAKSGKAFVDVSIHEDGSVTATGGCDSLIAQLKARDSILYKMRSEKTDITKTNTEFKTRQVDIFCRWFTGIVLLLLTAYVIYRFKF